MAGICHHTSAFIAYRPETLPAGFRMSIVMLMDMTAGARDEAGVRSWETYRKLT